MAFGAIMSWRVANSLLTLRDQLNQLFPKRSKVSDGTIGDTSHSARKSDHNPNDKGVVCAMDYTFDSDPSDGIGIDCNWLASVLVKNRDPRIKYIIWNRQIVSSKQNAWQWRPYKGPSPHNHHLHLSVTGDYDSKALWNLSGAHEDPVDNTVSKYAVRSGDTLSEIAKRFSTTVDSLKLKNGLTSDVIKIGQILAL